MGWNYRITRQPSTASDTGYWYEVREVFYEKDTPYAHCAVCIGAETPGGLSRVLGMMKRDMRQGVLDVDKDGRFEKQRISPSRLPRQAKRAKKGRK